MQNNDTENNFALDDEVVENTEVEQQEFAQVDPLQVEKELTDQFVDMQKNMNPEDVAAHFFQMFSPRYRQYLQGFNNKDLRRLCENIIEWPFNKDQDRPKFSDPDAKEAFRIGIQLLDCKMIMRNAFELAKFVEAQQATDAAKAKLEAEKQVEVKETNPNTEFATQTENFVQPNDKAPTPLDENGE